MNKALKSTKLQLTVILLLTFLAYSNIFQNSFATDDTGYIFNWQIPKHIQNIPKIFTTDSVPTDEQGVYRPVKALFLMASYYLFGFNATLFHSLSILIHLINTLLIYFIAKQMFSRDTRDTRDTLPFITALLFGLHPIHVEAITFITATFDTIGLTFYLGSFYFYLKSNVTMSKPLVTTSVKSNVTMSKPLVTTSVKSNVTMKQFNNRYYYISVALAALAFLTYELTLSLPLAIILYDFCFRFKTLAHPIRVSTNSKFPKDLKLFKIYLPFAGISVLYLFLRFYILHIPTRGEYIGGSFYWTMLVMVKALVEYIKTLIYPINLSMNHEIFKGVFSVVSKEFLDLNTLKSLSVFNPDILICLIILILLIVTAIKYYFKNPIITFAIGFFFITLLPVSFILPQSSIMAERYAYLASFSFCLLLALGLSRISEQIIKIIQNSKFKAFTFLSRRDKLCLPVLLTFVFVLLTFYFIRTYTRNRDFKDNLTVWNAMVSENPRDMVANLTLARIYLEQEKPDKSEIYFKKALQLNPDLPEAYYKLGQIYQKANRLEEAAGQYNSVLKYNSNFASTAASQLEKLSDIKQNNKPAQVNTSGMTRINLGEYAYFFAPGNWIIKQQENGVIIDHPYEQFRIEVSLDLNPDNLSLKDYMKADKSPKATVEKEGPALVPNVQEAYVKFIKEEGIDKLQFYLTDNNNPQSKIRGKIIKILTFPPDPKLTGEFNRILGSIVFKEIDEK